MMLRSAAVVLCLAAHARSAPPPPSGADALLGEAEAGVSALEEMAKGGADGTGCPPDFSLDAYIRDMKEMNGSKALGSDIPSEGLVKAEWEFYNVCRALAAKSERPCAAAAFVASKAPSPSPAFGPTEKYQEFTGVDREKKCIEMFRLLRAEIALIGQDPAFMRYCREMGPTLPPLKSPASMDSICSAWRDYAGDPASLTAAIGAAFKAPMEAAAARALAAELVVSPGWCEAWRSNPDPEDAKVRCREIGDYRAARARRGGQACRGGLCRMLTGAGAPACESYVRTLKKRACSDRYGAGPFAERSPLVAERLKQAESLLAEAGGRLGSLDEAKALVDRLDRLYALRGRLHRAALALGPARDAGGPAAK